MIRKSNVPELFRRKVIQTPICMLLICVIVRILAGHSTHDWHPANVFSFVNFSAVVSGRVVSSCYLTEGCAIGRIYDGPKVVFCFKMILPLLSIITKNSIQSLKRYGTRFSGACRVYFCWEWVQDVVRSSDYFLSFPIYQVLCVQPMHSSRLVSLLSSNRNITFPFLSWILWLCIWGECIITFSQILHKHSKSPYLPHHEPPLVIEWQRHACLFLLDTKPIRHWGKWENGPDSRRPMTTI